MTEQGEKCPKCGSERMKVNDLEGRPMEWAGWVCGSHAHHEFFQSDTCKLAQASASIARLEARLAAVEQERKAERDLLTEALECSPNQTMNFLIAMAAAKVGTIAKLTQQATLATERAERGEKERDELKALINCPHNDDWFEGTRIEAAHQQERWGNEHDEGKEPQDWFWLIGYLAGKCMRACIDGDTAKAKHHTISTAGVLLNWYRRISGQPGDMRPGIQPPPEPITNWETEKWSNKP